MKRICAIILTAIGLNACSEFVDVGTPKTQIVSESVFANDAGARAAIAGIYSRMMTSFSLTMGGPEGITAIAGLSADELKNYSTAPSQIALYNNSLTPVNTQTSAWTDMYSCIYYANAVIEGVNGSTGLSEAIGQQVKGEALFIRAFSYFYLINFFGDVPLIETTNYNENRLASRTPMSDVYHQIELDLLEAQKLLLEDYSFSLGEKVNPNKWVATALLARVYLYQEKWTDAQVQSSSIIESNQFSLVSDLNSVFLANSSEAIWQLMPSLPDFNTNDGPYFIITDNPGGVTASESVLDAFELDDKRAISWIGSYTAGDNATYYYVNKYKIHDRGRPLTEYQMVFRLAEQYLISAESKAMLNDLSGAADDLNIIRERAGVPHIESDGLPQESILNAVEQERRAELFIEWGHRWFDLKRSGRIDDVLGLSKPDWQSKDVLFPIPQSEINVNPNLNQNP